MRMLERFSKKKKHLYVKSVKARPKKKKVEANGRRSIAGGNPRIVINALCGADGSVQDEESDTESSKEKQDYKEVEFDFQKVEQVGDASCQLRTGH
jgi:hypothetical protein